MIVQDLALRRLADQFIARRLDQLSGLLHDLRIFRGAGPAPLPIATSAQGASFVVGGLNETAGAELEALRLNLKKGAVAWA
jgi:hypothetical protein